MSSVKTLAPIHATPMGVRVWLVPGGQCLIWSGAYNLVRLAPVITNSHGSAVGAPVEVIPGGRCESEADACAAVARWLTGAGFALVAFDSDDLAAGFYEDDELTAEGTDQATGAPVVVRADGVLATALRACALAGRDCAIPASPAMILTRAVR